MQKYLYGMLMLAMLIIAVLVIPAGRLSVSADKSTGGVREVIPAAVESQKAQQQTQE